MLDSLYSKNGITFKVDNTLLFLWRHLPEALAKRPQRASEKSSPIQTANVPFLSSLTSG